MNKLIRLAKAIAGLFLMIFRVRVFRPEKIFSGKSVAIVGPADSAYDEEYGDYIDQFDYVIRINKAITTWEPENQKFIGSRTDILLHSFNETELTGGGPLNFKLFRKHNIQYVLNGKNNLINYRHIFNVYKKYLTFNRIYILEKIKFLNCQRLFDGFSPTNGFRALHMMMTSRPKKIFITGFTFYKTPYADGYRDQFKDVAINLEHLKKSGVHDPDLEYSMFLMLLKNNEGKVILDSRLRKIVENDN
jgi:hypothetical protein